MAEQKKTSSTNGEFKTSPLGFDKNEVMAYIVQHNKERKALKEENDELKRALEEKQQATEGAGEELTAELEKKKAELDAQILESRKQVLDERRKLAQTEKELHVMQDKYSALTEEFAQFKKQAASKIDKAKHSGGTIDPAQLAEISAKANADANAVVADAQKKAEEIITAAKAYFADTVQKTYDYKQSVLEKADTFASGVTSGGATTVSVDVKAILAKISTAVNEAVEKAVAEANAVNEAVAKAVEETKAVNDVLAKAVEEAEVPEVTADDATDAPVEKLADDEELNSAKAELENIGGFDESELEAYAPMEVEPYNFELKLDMPAQTDGSDDDIDELLADNNGLLSSFEIVSGDDDISTDNVDTGDLLVEETPAVADDMADLLAEEPVTATAPKAESAPVADDFGDLLAEEPVAAPEPKAEPAPVADDFSDLLAEEPVAAPEPKAEPAPVADDFSDLLAEEPATAPEPKTEPAPVADDFSDLLAEEPVAAPEPKAEPAPVADDFSDLLAEEPVAAPEPKAEPAPVADDFSDLLADAPAPAERTTDRGSDKPKEKLNESRSMGVAGKEDNANDPWKDLEAQMNGMTITPPPSKKAADDDGMTSSFDDPTAPAASAKEEKIDMSDYSSMLGGINDNMTANTAQYDPSWDLKMMEGLNDGDDDDEMSSDNVGFFDL